jgi:hypothetical protein
VIYRARIAGMDQLHSATLAGGEPPLSLHQGVPVVEDDFLVSANGQYVFYRAEATAGTTRLFVLRTDGGWPQPFDLSGPLAAGGDVLSYRLTPDASRLVFLADKRTDEVFELFRRTVTTPAVLIHGMPAFADVTAYRLDPAAQRVQYLADRRVDGRDELYAAPLDGSSSPQRVSDDLLAGGDVRQDFVPMDGGAALYAADQVQDETFELFRGTEAPASPPAHLPAATPKQPASVVR